MKFVRQSRWLALSTVVVACGLGLNYNSNQIPESAATEPAGSGSGTSASKEDRSKAVHDLELRSAQILFRLAEVNLSSAQELNQKVPNNISKTSIDRITQIAKVAKDRLDALKTGTPRAQMWFITAQDDLQLAETNLQRGMALIQQTGGGNQRGVERLSLLRDLAQINVERAQIALNSPSPVDDLQWQLDRLQDALGNLTNSIDTITSRR